MNTLCTFFCGMIYINSAHLDQGTHQLQGGVAQGQSCLAAADALQYFLPEDTGMHFSLSGVSP